jgi:hypothetical protein
MRDQRTAGPAPERALVFVHVPKAGGTTLRRIIRRQYRPGSIHDVPPGSPPEIPPGAGARIRVLQGHIPYGSHHVLALPADYVTILRDPVDRVASLYYYARSRPSHEMYAWTQRASLAEFAAGGHPETLNHQCRLISGRLDDFTGATLAPAMDNLARRFACFGIHERFDESLLLFRRRLSWGSVLYLRENVTSGRPPAHGLDPAAVRRIRERNAFDQELYDHALALFDARVAGQPAEFRHELERFRRANRVYGVVSRGIRSVSGAAPGPVRRWARRTLDAVRASRLP